MKGGYLKNATTIELSNWGAICESLGEYIGDEGVNY